MTLPRTLGDLRTSEFGQEGYRSRTIKDEMRANLIGKLQSKEGVFSGIVGYEETVIPQVVNALLSRHNMILLGLRGQVHRLDTRTSSIPGRLQVALMLAERGDIRVIAHSDCLNAPDVVADFAERESENVIVVIVKTPSLFPDERR